MIDDWWCQRDQTPKIHKRPTISIALSSQNETHQFPPLFIPQKSALKLYNIDPDKKGEQVSTES